jgi:hypothetical protein
VEKQLHELLGVLKKSREPKLEDEQKTFLYGYFNLCAEEYLYYRKGFIYPEVWYSWVNGMMVFFVHPQIAKLWHSDLDAGCYYGLNRELWDKEVEEASRYLPKPKVLA